MNRERQFEYGYVIIYAMEYVTVHEYNTTL